MLKICYLADASSTHTKKFCDYFAKQGYEVHVISLNEGFIEGIHNHNFAFNVKELRNESATKKIKYLSVLKDIKKLINEIKPDIVHAHFATSYGLLGSLLNFKPYIISVLGTDVYEFPKKSFLHKSILKYNLKKADLILSTSVDMARETSLYTNKEIPITPFGVDIDFFKPIDEKKEKDSITIGTIKTLEDKYGIDYLIKAYKVVRDKFPNKKMSLLIGGDGSKKESLMNLCKDLGINDEVTFLGRVSQYDIVNIFNSLDIAVYPSLKESFGVAAVEAQACGIPVVATNIGGLPEATAKDKSALLVDSENIEQLSKAIISLVEDENKRKLMGEYGRKFVSERFDVEYNFKHINEIYIKALNK